MRNGSYQTPLTERGSKVPNINQLKFACTRCGWKRYLSNLRSINQTVVQHPIYGLVNLTEMAELDIAKHKCKYHLEASQRMKEPYVRLFPEH